MLEPSCPMFANFLNNSSNPNLPKLQDALQHQNKNVVRNDRNTYSFNTKEDGNPLTFLDHI